MWGVVVLVTAVSGVSCYATQEDFAARLPFITSCSVAAVVMLTLLVEKTMNHNGGVWRDGKYRRAVKGSNDKLFCMFCSPAFWAEALAKGFDSCGMDGGGLPRLALLAAPRRSYTSSSSAAPARRRGRVLYRGTDCPSNPPPAIPACPPSPPPP